MQELAFPRLSRSCSCVPGMPDLETTQSYTRGYVCAKCASSLSSNRHDTVAFAFALAHRVTLPGTRKHPVSLFFLCGVMCFARVSAELSAARVHPWPDNLQKADAGANFQIVSAVR